MHCLLSFLQSCGFRSTGPDSRMNVGALGLFHLSIVALSMLLRNYVHVFFLF